MSGWAPVTVNYTTSDGKDFAVEASTALPDEAVRALVDEQITVTNGAVLPVTEIVRPTVIFECTAQGQAVNLTPLYEYPPGTTHTDALNQAGYEVTQ